MASGGRANERGARERRRDSAQERSSRASTRAARSFSCSTGAVLPDDLVQAVERYKFRGSSGKVNLALSEAPDFTGLPRDGEHLRGAISISPSYDYLERAYDDAKYGEFSRRPYMDIVIPSADRSGMAPPGRHVMSIFVQYAPYHVNGGWTDRGARGVRRRRDRHAVRIRAQPEVGDSPPAGDHAARHRAHHRTDRRQHLRGRAVAAASCRSCGRRPAGRGIERRSHGYYQCGSGTHPGGGVMGASGRLAAMRILSDGR